MFRKVGILGLCLLAFGAALAQTAPSPFTSQGIGSLDGNGLIQQDASGAVGVGMGSYWNINNINPAMLMFTRGTIFNGLTVFQAGVKSEYNTIRNVSSSERSAGTNLSYLSMGFPIIPDKWFSSLGLRPFSTVNYNLNYETTLPGSPYSSLVTEEGSGGFNQLYWANGVAVSKNISVGLRSQFLFSSIFTEITNEVNTIEIPVRFAAAIFDRKTVSGMNFTGGIIYQDSIKTKGDEPLRFTLGLTYDLSRDIRVKQFESIQRRTLSGSIWEADTVQNNTIGSMRMPSGIGVGIGFSKGYKWSAGVDFRMNKFSEFTLFDQSIGTDDSFFLGAGGEFTPDAFSVEDYFKRVTYRIGVNYERTPYLINGMNVNDFGINFGFSLPIVPSTTAGAVLNKGFSSVDFGFKYGILGSVGNNLIEQEYFKVHFGVTFNDKWFVKRRFN